MGGGVTAGGGRSAFDTQISCSITDKKGHIILSGILHFYRGNLVTDVASFTTVSDQEAIYAFICYYYRKIKGYVKDLIIHPNFKT